MLSDQSSCRIGKLKIHSRCSDSPGLRMNISRTFSTLDMQPAGMPPSAILLIRKINDPMPGTLYPEMNNKAGKHAAGKKIKRSWKISLYEQISSLYRVALRPANGMPGCEHEAVLFNDTPELLACFCRDILLGDVRKKWWWRRCFGQSLQGVSPQLMISNILVERSSVVPAVMTLLAEWHCAVKFINVIGAHTCQQITQAVLHEYSLAELEGMLRNCDYSCEGLNSSELRQSKSSMAVNRFSISRSSNNNDDSNGSNLNHKQQFETISSAVPPWLNLFGSEIWGPGLCKEQLLLLGLARLIQSSPVMLRSDDFQKQVADWWSAADKTDALQQETAFESIIRKRDKNAGASKSLVGHKQKSSFLLKPQISFDVTDTEDKPAGNNVESNSESINDVDDFTVRRLSEKDGIQSMCHPHSNHIYSVHEPQQTSPVKHRSFEAAPALSIENSIPDKGVCDASKQTDIHKLENMPASRLHGDVEDAAEMDNEINCKGGLFSDTCIETELGGVLFLINLLKQLDLPDCLSKQLKLDQKISRWALLDAISRALLGKKYFTFCEDPIWRILAGLDQRRNKAILGQGFHGLSDYYMPCEWFHYFTNKSLPQFIWALHNKRLRIWSQFGIVAECKVIDFDAVESQVIKVLKQYTLNISPAQISIGRFSQAPKANRKLLEALGIDSELVRLLSFVLPVIHRYLQINLTLTTVTPSVLLKMLLQCDGQIFISSSHIDLVANINSASCVIRRSGLDQDPGWLPLYGRVVLFHYSQI